jgi:murein DD-endopeptidase MepM/ murein hydrolase activator NlpD
MLNKSKKTWLFAGLAGTFVLGVGMFAMRANSVGFLYLGGDPSSLNLAAQPLATEPPIPIRPSTSHEIAANSSVYSALRQVPLSAQDIFQIVEATEEVQSLRKVQSGLKFDVEWQDNSAHSQPIQITFHFSPIRRLVVAKTDTWNASIKDIPVETKSITFSGLVKSSLWESAENAGMNPDLIGELALVFAWQVDFNREVRKNDRWRLIVEQKFAEGKLIGFGSIMAAEYENAGTLFSAVRFPTDDDGHFGYFMPDGTNLKRMFLKSPIKFGRITSKFKLVRFHPILRQNRPHNGVDYGAPPGTPVMSVGRGIVEFAGRNGGSGNMVKIRHNSSYNTAYLHLRGFARGIARGTKVEQGQVIGYVGSTGLANGPHLHFAFYENGRYVDPLGRKFPSADPVPARSLADFKTLGTQLLTQLPPWQETEEETQLVKNP